MSIDKLTQVLCEAFEKGEVPKLEKILDDADPDEFWQCRCGGENAIGAESCKDCAGWRPNVEVKDCSPAPWRCGCGNLQTRGDVCLACLRTRADQELRELQADYEHDKAIDDALTGDRFDGLS